MRRAHLRGLAWLGVFALGLGVSRPSPAATPPVPPRLVVVVSAGSTLKEISHGLLRRVFLGEPAEHGGVRLIPLNYAPGDPLRSAFDRAALGLSPDAVGRYWVDRRIRGQGLPPRTVGSAALMRAVVARLPGAIGYLPREQLGADLRALPIDGITYDDPEYLLVDE